MTAVVGHIVRMRRNAHAVVLPFVNDRIGILFSLSVFFFLTFWAWDDYQVFWMEAVDPPFLYFFCLPVSIFKRLHGTILVNGRNKTKDVWWLSQYPALSAFANFFSLARALKSDNVAHVFG